MSTLLWKWEYKKKDLRWSTIGPFFVWEWEMWSPWVDANLDFIDKRSFFFCPFWIFKVVELHKGFKVLVDLFLFFFEGLTKGYLCAAKSDQFFDFFDENFLNALLLLDYKHVFLPAVFHAVNKLFPWAHMLYS